jgi:hypothetical protein
LSIPPSGPNPRRKNRPIKPLAAAANTTASPLRAMVNEAVGGKP